MKKRVVLKDDPDSPVVEQVVLTKAILEISASMKKLLKSGLNKRAVIVLVHDSCVNVGKPSIRAVLDSLETLAKDYTV
jgi:hypothetical protein